MSHKTDYLRLRELVSICEGHKSFKASLLPPRESQWGLETQLDNGRDVYWNENPWVVEDWPELQWRGNYFFHRSWIVKDWPGSDEHGKYHFQPSSTDIYLVEGTSKDFSGSIYRPRLRAFQKMVRWALPDAEVGFTVTEKVSEKWGYLLCSPWLIKSIDNCWLQRIKMFSALNEFRPASWPMSLLLEHWKEVRKILF